MALIPQLRLWLSAYPGAKLFSYIAGSTTKQNSYSDSALTTPNANPVVADSGGLFGSIYLDPALSYKFVLAPSTDTDPPTSPLYTQDNVTTVGLNTLTLLSKVADYSVAATDGDDVIVLVDATLGNVTVSLYTAVGNSGKKVRVVKTDSSANTVTVDPSGTQTWSGATTRVLGFQWQATNGAANGANWDEFAQGNMGSSVSSTGVVDWTGRIRTTNVGPHAVGLAVSTASQWKIGGTHAPTGANAQDNVYEMTSTVTLEVNASAAGMYINPTFTEAGSGTHAIIAGIWIPQYTVTNAAAAVTNAAGLYIANAPSATGASAWAMWVAAGASRFDDDVVFGADKTIRRNTADGSDSGTLWLTGGGNGSASAATVQTQGGLIRIGGNESATTGSVQVYVGNVAGSAVTFVTAANTNMLSFAGSDGSGTFTSSRAQATGPAWTYVNSNASPQGIQINYSGAAPNDTTHDFLLCYDGTTRAEIRSNGGLANFSANNVNLSDADVKEIAGVAPPQRELFRRLTLVAARYLDAPDTPLDIMVTAQDVERIYPTLITDFDGHKGVREHGLMMRAFKVIQELDADVTDLRARMDARTIH